MGRDRSDQVHRARRRSSATSRTSSRRLPALHVTDAFLPVVAPASVVPARKDEFYKSEEEALFAIADALREEYQTIVDAGLIAQIDDAFLASTYDVMVPPKTLEDYRKWAEVRVEALNHALRGHSRGAHALSPVLGKLERAAHQRRRA